MRQRGKVAELALGFCGGEGALQAMAAAYGLHLDDAEAQDLVDAWREANPWAVTSPRELWDAMRWRAMMPDEALARPAASASVYLAQLPRRLAAVPAAVRALPDLPRDPLGDGRREGRRRQGRSRRHGS